MFFKCKLYAEIKGDKKDGFWGRTFPGFLLEKLNFLFEVFIAVDMWRSYRLENFKALEIHAGFSQIYAYFHFVKKWQKLRPNNSPK